MRSESVRGTVEVTAPGTGLSVAEAEVRDGPSAVRRFPVTLKPASTRTVTVRYATSDGTAEAGSDYTAVNDTLTFAPGETKKTVSVLDDSHDEGMETLTLTQASGAAIASASATGRIVNTDAMPQAWLARIGRKVAEQVIEAVRGRLRAPPRAGMEASLAGQALPRWRRGPPRTRSTAGQAASWRRRPT